MPAPPSDPSPAPKPLHERALDDLSFIRRTMEGASAFTDVSGWGLAAAGATALGAAALSAQQPSAAGWLTVWVAEALVGAAIGTATTLHKIRRRNGHTNGAAQDGAPAPLLSTPARRFSLSFWPSIVAGGILTAALTDWASLTVTAAPLHTLPGLWLLLYGLGILTAGAYSVRPIPVMGALFMLLGAATLLLPVADVPVNGTLMLATGFGGLHLAFGIWIARHHGG